MYNYKSGKKHRLKKNFGLTVEQYDAMFEEQAYACAICDVPAKELDRELSVDHDHETGKIRALLCTGCNRGLGFFNDSPEKLLAASKYLRLHGK